MAFPVENIDIVAVAHTVLHNIVVETAVDHDMKNFENHYPCKRKSVDPSIVDHKS